MLLQDNKFSSPIILRIPLEDNAAILQKAKTTIFSALAITPNHGYQRIDKSILAYLLKEHLARIEPVMFVRRTDKQRLNFLFYSDRFKNSPIISKCRIMFWSTEYCVNIAKRKVVTVDYRNRYKGSPGGIEVTFYAMTFQYKLELNDWLPNFPPVSKLFRGKTKAFLDPDDGEWKNSVLEISDNDNEEFLKALKNKFKQ